MISELVPDFEGGIHQWVLWKAREGRRNRRGKKSRSVAMSSQQVESRFPLNLLYSSLVSDWMLVIFTLNLDFTSCKFSHGYLELRLEDSRHLAPE